MSFGDFRSAFMAFLVIFLVVSTSTGLTVRGAAFIGEVSPGQKIVHTMTVSLEDNETSQKMTADVYGFAMNMDGTNMELSPEDDTGPFTARTFLSVEPKNFTIEPGVPQKVNLTGTVPEDSIPGGRYAIVSLKTEPEGNKSISITSEFQVLVLLTIKDSAQEKTGTITDLNISTGNNVSVNLVFENTGNVYYKPFIGAVLKDDSGQVAIEIPPKKISASILPTNSRRCSFDVAPLSNLTSGKYTIEVDVTLEDGTLLDSKEIELKIP
ncbi:MAG TPA: hypothetical protein PKK68_04865 [Methanothrix soehngenii]|nr:hypothetical protein [Methanothrix soehngenii]